MGPDCFRLVCDGWLNQGHGTILLISNFQFLIIDIQYFHLCVGDVPEKRVERGLLLWRHSRFSILDSRKRPLDIQDLSSA